MVQDCSISITDILEIWIQIWKKILQSCDIPPIYEFVQLNVDGFLFLQKSL